VACIEYVEDEFLGKSIEEVRKLLLEDLLTKIPKAANNPGKTILPT
jgi:hypothetical protein